MEDNFWSKVEVRGVNECWPWHAALAGGGYGIYTSGKLGKKRVYAHRYAYEMTFGPIPAGMYCMHKCDNPCCVNPNHLTVGSCSDNLHDMVTKGRSSRGERRWCAKLTAETVRQIRKRYAAGNVSCIALAAEYGVSTSAVQLAVGRKTWKHVE
jgi:hypothetical protein